MVDVRICASVLSRQSRPVRLVTHTLSFCKKSSSVQTQSTPRQSRPQKRHLRAACSATPRFPRRARRPPPTRRAAGDRLHRDVRRTHLPLRPVAPYRGWSVAHPPDRHDHDRGCARSPHPLRQPSDRPYRTAPSRRCTFPQPAATPSTPVPPRGLFSLLYWAVSPDSSLRANRRVDGSGSERRANPPQSGPGWTPRQLRDHLGTHCARGHRRSPRTAPAAVQPRATLFAVCRYGGRGLCAAVAAPRVMTRSWQSPDARLTMRRSITQSLSLQDATTEQPLARDCFVEAPHNDTQMRFSRSSLCSPTPQPVFVDRP